MGLGLRLWCGDSMPSYEFCDFDAEEMRATLVSELTPVADLVRDIGVSLGARQYQVTLVWTRWSGGSRGVGNEFVIQELRVLPTPSVRGLTPLHVELQDVGADEVGVVTVSEISPRFCEDTLAGRDVVVQRGDPIPDDVNFYWEVYYPQTTDDIGGTGDIRRRFVLAKPPSKSPTSFEWVVEINKASDNRERSGELT